MLDLALMEAAWQRLLAAQAPVLVSHRKPDGDALGSIAALQRALVGQGRGADVALFEPLPARYADFATEIAWAAPADPAAAVSAADLLVILDTGATAQLEPIAVALPDAPPTIVIDHHATGDEIGYRPEDIRLCDPTAAANCVLLTEWLIAMGAPPDRGVAEPLFIGIATDTGWFRFSNADARTLRAAATLLDTGLDNAALFRKLYEHEPLGRLRLRGRVLETLELRAGGALAVLRLRQSEFDELGADQSLTEDLVNGPAALVGLEATVMFTEQPDGTVRANFRSKTRINVAEIAGRFGGGGHERAAGARLDGGWDTVTGAVIAALEAALAPPA